MTREIKFRAWDGEKIIYNIPNSAVSVGSYLEMMGTTLKLMQYTGLKDKNDKEIYEGDIIVYPDGINTIGYEDGSFVRYFKESGHTPINQKDMLEIEIIGNIYENPELLNA